MSGVLTLDYRPVTFADVVGQGHIKPILKAMVQSGRMPPALIFGGTRGTGKTTCARILAAALNCTIRKILVEQIASGMESVGNLTPDQQRVLSGDACGQCPSCMMVQKTNSTSVMEVDAASNGGVEEVRRIKDICMYSHEAEWRVVLLDEAHSMSKEAFNALLKLLEEPPPNTVFVLLTTETDKILETVRSRSMPFEFRRMKLNDMTGRLQEIAKQEGIEASEDLLMEIAIRAQGGMRDAVMLFDQVTRVGVSTAEEFMELFGLRDYSIPLMWCAIRGDHAEGYRLIGEHFARTGEASGMVSDLSQLVAELLVIKSDGQPRVGSEAAMAERVEMAGAVSTSRLVKAVEVLWELRGRTRATENDQRSNMELGFALIANAMRDLVHQAEEPRQTILTQKSEEKLSLADISRMGSGGR